MAIYAVVQDGVVTNTIEWNGVTAWPTPVGASVVKVPDGASVGIGSTYASGVFSAPPSTPVTEMM